MVSLKPSIISTIVATLSVLNAANALIPLVIDNNRFVKPAYDPNEDGEVFFIKGVDYQPGGSSGYSSTDTSDVLSDAAVCLRDATALQNLGANTIRVYTINPAINHDECMSIFNAAGIYVIIDVNTPLDNQSLNRADPASSYNWWYLNNVFNVIDAFKNFPNLIGFFSGNEIINDGPSAKIDPRYIRAVQRDMKQYIKNQCDRDIPVGYSAADVVELRSATFQYLQCSIDGKEDESKSDFFGLNSYEWCSGTSNWQSSGYDKIESGFENSTIPVFFSEYGCNKNSPRTFDEVSEGVFGGLIDTLSGGLVYEYSQEAADYGLVTITDDGDVKFTEDYDNLKSQLSKSNIPTIKSNGSSSLIVKCSSSLVSSLDSSFSGNFTLPQQPGGLDKLIKYGANNTNIGEIVDFDSSKLNYTLYDSNGDKSNSTLVLEKSNLINAESGVLSASSSSSDSTTSSSSIVTSSSITTISSTSSSATVSSISSKSSHAGAPINKQSSNGALFTGLAIFISALF